MEIKTCEEYVLNELKEAQDRADRAEAQVQDLQAAIGGLRYSIIAEKGEDGKVKVDVNEEMINSDAGYADFIMKVLGINYNPGTPEDNVEG